MGIAVRTLLIATGIAMLGLAAVSAYILFESDDDPAKIARNQFLTAYEQLLPEANRGDLRARIAIGDLLRDTPVEHGGDPARAAAFYQAAAKDGFATAQTRLGQLYEQGLGVPRDIGRAYDLYRIAAQVGRHADAQYALAQMYYQGRGVAHDYGQAVDWYMKAASGGHPVAQFLVGRMYRDGWGINTDIMEAYIWFSLAAEHSEIVRAVDPGFHVIKEKDDVQAALNAHQIREGNRRADQRRVRR